MSGFGRGEGLSPDERHFLGREFLLSMLFSDAAGALADEADTHVNEPLPTEDGRRSCTIHYAQVMIDDMPKGSGLWTASIRKREDVIPSPEPGYAVVEWRVSVIPLDRVAASGVGRQFFPRPSLRYSARPGSPPAFHNLEGFRRSDIGQRQMSQANCGAALNRVVLALGLPPDSSFPIPPSGTLPG